MKQISIEFTTSFEIITIIIVKNMLNNNKKKFIERFWENMHKYYAQTLKYLKTSNTNFCVFLYIYSNIIASDVFETSTQGEGR